MTAGLRERIAAELKRNDECGPGPVSDMEYLDDADAILRIVRQHDKAATRADRVSVVSGVLLLLVIAAAFASDMATPWVIAMFVLSVENLVVLLAPILGGSWR